MDDRGARLRDFLDPWWIYERQLRLGHGGTARERFVKVDRDGVHRAHTFDAPCPVAHKCRLPRFDFVSPAAQRILDMGSGAKKHKGLASDLQLVCDHVVPFGTLSSGLFGLDVSGPGAIDRLTDFLRFHFKRAVISKPEHDEQLGGRLKHGMPENWDFWDDPFERYRVAKII